MFISRAFLIEHDRLLYSPMLRQPLTSKATCKVNFFQFLHASEFPAQLLLIPSFHTGTIQVSPAQTEGMEINMPSIIGQLEEICLSFQEKDSFLWSQTKE